jgi:phytoene dehydrogenase-like protein
VGGAAVTEEIIPGFKFSVCSYVVSLLRPEIIRELELAKHGLEILPLDGTFTPMPNGDYLWRVDDHAQTYREIARHSRLDADVYDEYGRAMVEMGRFAKAILAMTPPDPFSMRVKDLRVLGALAKRFRDLPDTDRYHQLQLLTMSAVDFLDQCFETDVLKATMSASGIIGTFQGVRSPGTAYVLLHHYMGEIDGAFRSWGLSKGGTGQVSNAIAAAATAAGAEIRVNSAVRHILVSGNEATGVVLENGDYHMASVVLSSVDPRLTFLHMVGPDHLPAEFVEDIRRYKFRGESRARRSAELHVQTRTRPASARRDLDVAERRLHGARVRRREVRTVFEASVRGHRDPEPDGLDAGTARQTRHVVLRAVRALCAPRRHVGRRS